MESRSGILSLRVIFETGNATADGVRDADLRNYDRRPYGAGGRSWPESVAKADGPDGSFLGSTRRGGHVVQGLILYSITSAARAGSVGGTSRPSPFAALGLMTNSNLVGAWTGRSPGFAPRRMRSTYSAARRKGSLVPDP
jgi:hypothetical protein